MDAHRAGRAQPIGRFALINGGMVPLLGGASYRSGNFEERRERRRHDQIADDSLARRGELPLVRLFAAGAYGMVTMSAAALHSPSRSNLLSCL
jgi:hypothetical protein